MVERINVYLTEKERSFLLNVELSNGLWEEAINMLCYLINGSPCASLDRNVIK